MLPCTELYYAFLHCPLRFFPTYVFMLFCTIYVTLCNALVWYHFILRHISYPAYLTLPLSLLVVSYIVCPTPCPMLPSLSLSTLSPTFSPFKRVARYSAFLTLSYALL